MWPIWKVWFGSEPSEDIVLRQMKLTTTPLIHCFAYLDGYRCLVRHSARQHLHRNVLAVHVVVDVGVHALRQDARVPEQVLRADEHELGQHDRVPTT